ncbi:MAG: glycine cleavage system aminomethyltransferase GcvT [Bryobacterales bacterium]|nr:glycine cleavage system aminomethyltransferase GcvT [Acidobacteriota bacterium]MCB9384891.1 glycine cleavage system aminomethyltransferase GcvT [Bryobacterales bacterium]
MAAESTSAELEKTPLNDAHRALGAKMVDFGGWDMPVEYSGILAEHQAVRERVGLFDVSHMGEIEIRGPQALDLVEHVTSNRAASLEDGQAHYSGLLNERGGFIDDLLVHRMDPNRYFLCVNAGNQDRDYAWIRDHNSFDAEVEFQSHLWAQLAIQGPRALATLQKLTGVELDPIRYYWFTLGEVSGASAVIARTGYTGEDGFEIYVQAEEAERLWNEILAAGEEFGILPCGLGARNTLRLEAGMALHGHEISEDITPYEANLGWIVKLKKGDFLGRDALVKQKEAGVKRKTVGFEIRGRGIGRDGYRVFADGSDVGFVTSGGPSPTLGKNIGIAMVPAEMAVPGRPIEIEIRTRRVEAETVSLPFYTREKK